MAKEKAATCGIAAKMGARVSGIDASEALINIAKRLVPEGDFRQGEMEQLPYADNLFDVVTGFNAFQYAADPVNALKEARRVARPGGSVVIVTWGKPEDCEVAPCLAALRPLMPPPAPGAAGPFALSQDGALEALDSKAGLVPTSVNEVDCPFTYSDLETSLKAAMSNGPVMLAILNSGEEKVRQALTEAQAPFKLASGSYRLENRFRYLVAKA